jgi:steroid Delta-isomerase
MDAADRLVAYFQSLTPQRVAQIGEYYAADAYFKDPFNEVHRVEEIRAIFVRMFEQLEAPRFQVLERIFEGDQGFLIWDMEFRLRGQSHVRRIHGVSHLRFDATGKVAYHRDYWDTAEELYERLPVLGAFMRWLKRRVG